jgi:putative transposase
VSKNCGKILLAPAVVERLCLQYRNYPDWSYQLHYDNLAVVVNVNSSLGELRSYSTVKCYMQARGLLHKPRPAGSPNEERAEERHQAHKVHSYEAEYIRALWHLNFHHGSRRVLTSAGQWQRPIALGILDDHSRLCCYIQWYLSETAEDLLHRLSQAI